MIEIQGLVKNFNNVTAVNIPRLIIPDGESFGLVGNNGAGKTTLLSLLLDLLRPISGTVLSKGKAVMQSDHWKEYTGAYLDQHMLINFLTPEEYFQFIAGLNRLNQSQYNGFLESFREFFNNEILDQNKYIRDFSQGNQKKIGIAAAMMGEPEVLILDEPFPHLDPTTVIRLKKALQNLRLRKNVVLIISSHDLNHVTELCDRTVVIEKGAIVHDLLTNDDTLQILQKYFGFNKDSNMD
jgi:ABC-2 type transport system ATP-binding protein